MIVLRSTMDEAVEAAKAEGWKRYTDLANRFGNALQQVTALQQQLSAWVRNEPGDITPEQMADMFYAQDDRWQAAFFNSMQARITAYHDAQPPAMPGEFRGYAGVPAGEAQWWHMAQHLDQAGFETIEAMFDHAKTTRERLAA